MVNCSSNIMTSTSSHVYTLTSCVHCMAIQFTTCLEADTCSPGRRCCSTITLSLWTRRYDICVLDLLSTILKMIRSSGSGRSLITFINESGLALISILKGSDGGCPKLFSFRIAMLSVRWYRAFRLIHAHKLLTSQNDRLNGIREH